MSELLNKFLQLFGLNTKDKHQNPTNKKESTMSLQLNRDEKLSNDFTLEEFLKSETASRKNIDNNPGSVELKNIRTIVKELLQPLRTDLASPLIVTSGYRSPELNKEIGGSESSQHMSGEAVDIESSKLNTFELAKHIKDNYSFDQLILEFYNPDEGVNSGWVHVSYVSNEENRKEVLTAMKTSNGVQYLSGLVTEEP